MGIAGGPSNKERGDLQLLPAPLHRHHVHYPREEEDSLLHDEPDRTVHCPRCLDCLLILPAARVRWADGTRHNDTTRSDSVHDGVYRQCAEDFGGDTSDWQVFRYCPGASNSGPSRHLFDLEGVSPRSGKKNAKLVPQDDLWYPRPHAAGLAVRRAKQDEARRQEQAFARD